MRAIFEQAGLFQSISGCSNCAQTSRALNRENLEALANHMLKGSADDVAAELWLSLRKRGGEEIGKRRGRTQNLRHRTRETRPCQGWYGPRE